jgi:hypothetical protein
MQLRQAVGRLPASIQIYTSAAGAQFKRFETGRDAEPDLTLDAQWLQRNCIIGAAIEPVRAHADTSGRAALRATIAARQITRSEPADRGKYTPRQR